MRLILLFFWRDIVNNLTPEAIFKLQLKINLSGPIESKDKTEASLKYNKEVKVNRDINKTYSFNSTDSVYKGTPTIRSIGSVNIYNPNNFYEALSYFDYHLSQHVDDYIPFPVTNVILTYNICPEDSILNTLNLKHRTFNQLKKNHKKELMKKNKETLKIDEKNLPLTTNLSK
jgi:hypothetical protein